MINRFASSTPRSEKSVSFIDSEDSMESQYSEVFNSTPISNNINNNINNNNNNNNNNNTPYRRVTRAQKASLKQKDLLLDEISYEDSQKEDDSQQPILNYQQKKKPRQIHNRVIPTRELIFSSKSGENFKNQKIYLNQKLPQYVAVHQDQVIPLRKSVYRSFKTQHNFSEFLKKPDISDLIFQKHFLLTLRDPNFLVKKWALEKLLIRTFVSKKPMQISLDFQIQNSLANLFSLLWIFLIKNEEKFKEEEIFILGEENDRNIFSKLQKEIFKDNNNNQDNINNENENKNQENKDEKNEIEDNEIQNNSEKRHLKKIKIEKSQTQIEEEIIKDESDIEIGQYNQFNNYNENIENNIEESNQNFDENNNENDENNNENDKNNNENDKNNDENNDNNKNNKNIENELFNNPQIQLDNQIREEQKMKGEQYREYSKIMQKKFHKENFENLTPSLTLEILKLLTTIIHNFSLNPPHYWLLNHEILFPGIIEIFCCQDISLARLGLDILNTISWEIVLEKKNEKILGFLYSFLYLGEIRDYSLVILSLSVLQKLARPENYIFFSRFESKFYERLADLLLIFFMEDQNQKQEKLREILNQKETEKETQQNDNQNQNNNQKENKKESEKENKKESEKENKKESEKENKKESEKEEKSTNKNKKKKTKKKKNEEEPLGKKENPIPILINLFLSFLQISPEVISSISKIENIVPLFVDISVLLRNEIEVEFYEKILIILNIILTKENSSYLKKFQFHFIELSCTQKKEEKMIAHLAAQILEHLFFVNQDFVE